MNPRGTAGERTPKHPRLASVRVGGGPTLPYVFGGLRRPGRRIRPCIACNRGAGRVTQTIGPVPRTTTDPYVLDHQRRGAGATDGLDPLVEGAKAGRMEAWGALYQEHYAALYRHVRYLAGQGGTSGATEDLVQEVFARALVALTDFDGRSSFSTWLHGIAINVVRNEWRSSKSTQTAHDRLRGMAAVAAAPAAADVDRVHMARRKAEALYAVLDTLPDHLREAFVLRDLEGMSPADAASVIGISPGNVSVRATRARERIRAGLESLGWLGPQGAAPSPAGGTR